MKMIVLSYEIYDYDKCEVHPIAVFKSESKALEFMNAFNQIYNWLEEQIRNCLNSSDRPHYEKPVYESNFVSKSTAECTLLNDEEWRKYQAARKQEKENEAEFYKQSFLLKAFESFPNELRSFWDKFPFSLNHYKEQVTFTLAHVEVWDE